MGFFDGWSDPVKKLSGLLGGQTSAPPGVGTYNSQASGDFDPSNPGRNPNFQPVPGQPGKYYDSATGQIVTPTTNNGGMTVAAAPNSNQLTAGDVLNQQTALAAQQGTQAGIYSNVGAMNGVVNDYNNTINNPNAPSVARSQLATGLNALAGRQESIAASANGANAGMANRAMAQNIAGAQAQENGQAAQLRAGEVAAAQTGKANTLNAIGNQLNSLNNEQGQQGLGYAGDATRNQGDVMGVNEKSDEYNATADSNLTKNVGGAVTAMGGA